MMHRSFSLLVVALLLGSTGNRVEPGERILLWAPPAQAGGATPSAPLLKMALDGLGAEVLETTSLTAQPLEDFKAVFAVLGTFPRNHSMTSDESDALASYLEDRRGALYLEGGDAWTSLPARLVPLLGVEAEGDGADDLATLEGQAAGPLLNLNGLSLEYEGEKVSVDRIRPQGAGAAILWKNGDTGRGLGVFRAADGGHRVLGVSFEFGGIVGDREPVLRSYLEALGVVPSCGAGISSFSSRVEGDKVALEWTNGAAYREVELRRDGAPLAILAGAAGEFEDRPGPGVHRYEATGRIQGCRTAPAFATAWVLQGAHLVWRPRETLAGPSDSAREIRQALEANGRPVVISPRLLALDLSGLAGLWVVLGTDPHHRALSAEEGQLLADYLAGGLGPLHPRLYIEGGEIWGNDPPTALRGLDGVLTRADGGARRLRHIRGLDAGSGFDISRLVRLPVDYTSENESIDVIGADPAVPGAGTAWIDDDSGETLGVFRRHPEKRYALLSVSFEFGGITHTRDERALLMDLYLQTLESPVARFRRGDVDGSGVLSLSDPIQMLGRLFLGGSYDQDCEDAVDADDDGIIGLTDAIVILEYLFLGGPRTAPPGPLECGPDPTTGDGLKACRPRETACR